jgi:hypothetical protein
MILVDICLFCSLFLVFIIVQLGPDAYEQSCSDGGPGGPGGSGFGHPFGDVFSEVCNCFIAF